MKKKEVPVIGSGEVGHTIFECFQKSIEFNFGFAINEEYAIHCEETYNEG